MIWNHVSRGGGEPLGLFRAPHGPGCSQVHLTKHSYPVQTAGFPEWGLPPGLFEASCWWCSLEHPESSQLQCCEENSEMWGAGLWSELWGICSRLQRGLAQVLWRASQSILQCCNCMGFLSLVPRLQGGLDQALWRDHPSPSHSAVIVHSHGIPGSHPTLLPVQFHLPLGSRFKTSGAAWAIFIENQALSINSNANLPHSIQPVSWKAT